MAKNWFSDKEHQITLEQLLDLPQGRLIGVVNPDGVHIGYLERIEFTYGLDYLTIDLLDFIWENFVPPYLPVDYNFEELKPHVNGNQMKTDLRTYNPIACGVKDISITIINDVQEDFQIQEMLENVFSVIVFNSGEPLGIQFEPFNWYKSKKIESASERYLEQLCKDNPYKTPMTETLATQLRAANLRQSLVEQLSGLYPVETMHAVYNLSVDGFLIQDKLTIH